MNIKTLATLLALVLPLLLSACGKKDQGAGDSSLDAVPAASTDSQSTGDAVAPPATEDAAAAEQPPPAPTPLDLPGDKYGNGVSVTEVISVSELMARANELDGQRVRVEGEVLEVCKKKGCWMNLAGDQPGAKIRIKVSDDVIVFPTTAEGRYAVAEGLVKKMALSLAETRAHLSHEAEEQGRDFDPASITEAITIVRIDGLGAMIRDTK